LVHEYPESSGETKEKGSKEKLKEYSRLKSHESLSEYGFQDRHHLDTFVLASRPLVGVAWGSPLQLITTDQRRGASETAGAVPTARACHRELVS
jgi:hypothetical protein